MKLTEIAGSDTPIIIDMIRQRVDKQEAVVLDTKLPVESGVDIGSGAPDFLKPEKCQGTITDVHPASRYGGAGVRYPKDRLFVEIEYLEREKSEFGPNKGKNIQAIIALWADWVEEHLKLSKTRDGWKVHL